MKLLTKLASALSAVVLSGCTVFGTSNVDSPNYQVLQKDGDFEIREYPKLTLVIADANPSMSERSSSRSNFGRLFDYISGENESGQEFSMTAPVIMEPGLTSMSSKMVFVLPSGVKQAPKAAGLQTQTLSDAKFAAYRFNGKLDKLNFEKAKLKLSTWMTQNNISGVSNTAYAAGYNAPWTINYFNTNDVLIPLEQGSLIK